MATKKFHLHPPQLKIRSNTTTTPDIRVEEVEEAGELTQTTLSPQTFTPPRTACLSQPRARETSPPPSYTLTHFPPRRRGNFARRDVHPRNNT